jgi:hypothetical protein
VDSGLDIHERDGAVCCGAAVFVFGYGISTHRMTSFVLIHVHPAWLPLHTNGIFRYRTGVESQGKSVPSPDLFM